MYQITLQKKHRKAASVVILFLVLIIGIIAQQYIGIVNSLAGIFLALCAFGTSYIMKFGGEKKFDIKKDYGLLIVPLLLLLVITYCWYAAFTLMINGIEQTGRIEKIWTEYESSIGAGQNPPMEYPAYKCRVTDFDRDIECDKKDKVGDTLHFLFARQLTGGFISKPPIVMQKPYSRLEAVLHNLGAIFFASVLYAISLFTVWFITLFNKGVVLLNNKLAAEKSKLQSFFFSLFYILSYITYIMFVVAFFKNIYNIVYQKYWNITFATLALLTILITDYGEKLFEYSTNIMLDLKSYRIVKIVKQVIKVTGYSTFAILLFSSIIHSDKSVFDLIFEFLNKHFGVNIKSFFDIFSSAKK